MSHIQSKTTVHETEIMIESNGQGSGGGEGDDDTAANIMHTMAGGSHHDDAHDEDHYHSWDTSEQRIISIVTRCAAAISIAAMAYIVFVVLRSSRLRSNIFHRLMLGMACNMILLGLVGIWGVAAVPEELGVYGARGNEETCAASGFLFQTLAYVVVNYYVSLSFYSFLAVRNDFDKTKYEWIEYWIHVNVYIFPILSAAILYFYGLFEYDGFMSCWISYDYTEEVECDEIQATASAENYNLNNLTSTSTTDCSSTSISHQAAFMLKLFLGYLPLIFLMVVAVVMMIAVYVTELQKEKQYSEVIGKKRYLEQARRAKSLAVARQALLYIFAFLVAFLPGAICKAVGVDVVPFVLVAIAKFLNSAQGLWILLAYLKLRRQTNGSENMRVNMDKLKNEISSRTHESTGALEILRRESLEFQFSIPLGINALTVVEDCSGASCTSVHSQDDWKESSIPRSQKRRLSKAKRRASRETEAAFDGFSIFDGSGAASARWREFIHDDDSADGEDFEESRRWESVVQT